LNISSHIGKFQTICVICNLNTGAVATCLGINNSGIEIADNGAMTGSIEINGNDIEYNTTDGLRIENTATVNADENWWGDASGPTHPSNSGGTGDSVIDSSNGGAGSASFADPLNEPIDPESCNTPEPPGPTPQAIPTLNEWGLIVMIIGLIGIAIFRRRQGNIA